MKQHAQAILLLTGHPLEPIVALEINKSLQSDLLNTSQKTSNQSVLSNRLRYKADETNEAWFNNYE